MKKQQNKQKEKFHDYIDVLVGVSGLTVGSFISLTGEGTSKGVPFAGCTSFIARVATFIGKQYFAKFKLRYTKMRDWIQTITILFEKTFNKSMKNGEFDGEEGEGLKKIYNHCFDKSKVIMKSTEKSYHEVFGGILGKECVLFVEND